MQYDPERLSSYVDRLLRRLRRHKLDKVKLKQQLAAAEAENKRLREIVEIIMTQHWDMAACNCWVCTKGREAGCSPMEKYLPLRKKGSGHGRVTVEPDGKAVKP